MNIYAAEIVRMKLRPLQRMRECSPVVRHRIARGNRVRFDTLGGRRGVMTNHDGRSLGEDALV